MDWLADLDAHVADAQRALLLRARRARPDDQVEEAELTVRQVAYVLRRSEDRVRMLLREGVLPGYRSGHEWRMHGRDLVLWMIDRRNRRRR
jgi:excisionase family DNA binding protein